MHDPTVADQELAALLTSWKVRRGRAATFEKLAQADGVLCSVGTVKNYLKPGHHRDLTILEPILAALEVSDTERAKALRLHQVASAVARPDPAMIGWIAAVTAADCAAWEMGEFTPAEATVHTAIGRRLSQPDSRHHDRALPPPYVHRDFDSELRTDVEAASRGALPAMILLRGGSSTGKTRSLYEAVHAYCLPRDRWVVVRPRTAAALRALPSSDLLGRRPIVLWLNELQGFLGTNGMGLSRDILRSIFAEKTEPIVVVATLCPDKLRAAIVSDHASDTSDLLNMDSPWIRTYDVEPTLSRSELAVARNLEGSDARIRDALADRDHVGFTQMLAGAHQLVEH